MNAYPPEKLDENEDDGTIVENVGALATAVVGHRIVSVETESVPNRWGSAEESTVIKLDDGTRVALADTNDCCAFTELESFLLHPERVDHIVTGVGTTDGYTTWHIYADLGDVMELKVGWSCGNPFYYGYGFAIQVLDAAAPSTSKDTEHE